jgi:hypothetical protein
MIYAVDFGLTCKYMDEDGVHVEFDEDEVIIYYYYFY